MTTTPCCSLCTLHSLAPARLPSTGPTAARGEGWGVVVAGYRRPGCGGDWGVTSGVGLGPVGGGGGDCWAFTICEDLRLVCEGVIVCADLGPVCGGVTIGGDLGPVCGGDGGVTVGIVVFTDRGRGTGTGGGGIGGGWSGSLGRFW